MRKILLTTIMAFGFYSAYCQQSETDAVKKCINTLFEGMRKGDSTMVKSTFAKSMVLQSIGTGKDGKAVLTNDSGDAFAKIVGTPHTGVYDERIVFSDIKIDGSLASVWAPYKFYLSDKFSHCGVDVFELMKTADGWKIIYIVDTRRKDACIE